MAQTFQNTFNATALPVCSTTAYADKDLIGATLEFEGAYREPAIAGFELNSVEVTEFGDGLRSCDLLLFSDEPNDTGNTITDNSALNLVATDWKKLVAVVSLDSADQITYSSDNTVNFRSDLSIPFGPRTDNNRETSIFGFLVARGAQTILSSDALQVKLGMLRD